MDISPDMIFVLLFLLGGFVASIPAGHFRKRAVEVRRWRRAAATVCGFVHDVDTRGRSFVYPKYKFSHEGREYTGVASVGLAPSRYEVLDPIEVLFDPANPAESDAPEYMRIGRCTFSSFNFLAVVFYLMSIIFIAVGIGMGVYFLFGK